MLIHDDKPRGFWKLGRVKEIIVGRDGHIRGAVLRVSLGNGKTSVPKCLIQLLYPLEVYCTTITRTSSAAQIQIMEETVTESMESATPHTEGVNDEVPKRPMRASASHARDRIKAWAIQEPDDCVGHSGQGGEYVGHLLLFYVLNL